MILNTPKTVLRGLPVLFLAGAAVLPAQTSSIRANISGGYGNNAGSGKCTIEVEVDGAAEVSVSGAQARLRNLSGSPAVFRRMDCTSALPSNPADFRFAGVDGRGRQYLVRDPRQGGQAVVRIEDSAGGREGYTFDLFWSGDSYSNGGFNNGGNWNPGYNDPYDDPYGGRNGGFGRNNGNVNGNRGGFGSNGGFGGNNGFGAGNARNALQACQAEVANRMNRDGYRNVQFGRVDFDNNARRSDRINGTVRANTNRGNQRFDFACRVDLSTGRLWDVRLDRR